MMRVWKVANYKDYAKVNYKASSHHMPLPVFNWCGLYNPFDHCTVPGQFSEGYTIVTCNVAPKSSLCDSVTTFQFVSFS